MATTSTRWDPWHELTNLRQTVDQIIDNSVSGGARFVRRDDTAVRGLALDVVEHPDRYTVRAAIPGMQPADIDISIDDAVLTIRGEHTPAEPEADATYIRRELRFGSFERSFTLPRGVDASRAEAKFEHGMLSLTLPKRVESQPTKIKVNVVSGDA